MSHDDHLFPVLLVGAGEVNFGSVEGPWNHSTRLENCLGSRLRVEGIVDPNVALAHTQRAKKLGTPHKKCWDGAHAFVSLEEAASQLAENGIYPKLVLLGTPPSSRGNDTAGSNGELECSRLFPNSAILVEKPLSAKAPDGVRRVMGGLEHHGGAVGVGYMLRYLKAVQRIKNIILDNKLVVMGTSARYIMAYPDARKPAWWNKSLSGGPIVEQATHLVDLSLFLAGTPVLSSAHAETVEHDDPSGNLALLGVDEGQIPPQHRLPRYTSATWRYENGAVGSLTHAISLHGNTYETSLEVIADGALLRLEDPYGVPKLHVRLGKNVVEDGEFPEDDPYQAQIDAFVAAAEGSNTQSGILCTYEDAVRTYELTWAIKEASDIAAADHRSRRS